MSKQHARYPAACGHAQHCCRKDETDAPSGFSCGVVIAHDQCVAGTMQPCASPKKAETIKAKSGR